MLGMESLSHSIQSDVSQRETDIMKSIFKPTPGKDRLVVSVVDNGLGISFQDKAKLFKLFGYNNSVEQENTSGIGLGLTISKQVVQAFDGQISVRSQVGVGSQFTFSMVLNEEEESQPDLRKLKFNASFTAVKKAHAKTDTLPKILIVDDEQFNLNIYSTFLKILKFDESRVTYCSNGLQSFDAVKKACANGNPHEYGLIFTDCNMPFCDGFQATKLMRNLWSDNGISFDNQPLVYAVTGHVEQQYLQKAKQYGMNCVFSKPMSIQTLAKLMHRLNYLDAVPDFPKV